MASNEIPAELLAALGAPAAAEQPDGGIPPELLAALGGKGAPAGAPEPQQNSMLSLLKSYGGGALNRIGHVASLGTMAAEATDVSRLSKMLANATGVSKAVAGHDLPVSDHSKTLAALKGLFTGNEPVSGFGDTLKEMDVPAVDVGAISPLYQLLKKTGAVAKDSKIGLDTNDAVGLLGDVTANPSRGIAPVLKGGGKLVSGAGNRIYDNAWRFITREFGGASASKNPNINKELFLQLMKENNVGAKAHSPQDIADQWGQVVAKESQPLNEMFAENAGKNIPLTQHSQTALGEIQDAVNTGDRATREAALERLKGGIAPEYHPFVDEMKNRLITSKGEVEAPLKNFIATLADGPLSLDQLRKYKGNQWKIAGKGRGTAAGEVATDLAGGTNDLLASTLENASVGGEAKFREANKRVATLLKPENALMRETKKLEGVAPNTALDSMGEAWAVMKLLTGDPKAAIELGTAIAAKKGGKALNAVHTGSRVGLNLIKKGEGLGSLADKLPQKNILPSAWRLLGGE